MADLGSIDQLLPLLLLCCMIPLLMRGGGSSNRAPNTEMDVWFTTFTAQKAFDVIIKETDDLRNQVEIKARSKKSRLPSFLNRTPKQRFVVDEMVTPNLYRITDSVEGQISFEISDAEEGGLQVKATFSANNKTAVQGIKARMPSRKLVAASKNALCPSCEKPRLPEWKSCPHCGNTYS